jgi:hypothetical protein
LAAHVLLTPRGARRIACTCALLATLGLAACGGDSSSGSSSTANASQQQQGAGGRRGFFQLDAKTRACLQKQGVTLPTGRRPPNGQPPQNGQQPQNGQTPNGQPPNGQRRNRNSAQFQKLRAAMAKCGVTFPSPGGGNGGPAPNQGTTSSSAS